MNGALGRCAIKRLLALAVNRTVQRSRLFKRCVSIELADGRAMLSAGGYALPAATVRAASRTPQWLVLVPTSCVCAVVDTRALQLLSGAETRAKSGTVRLGRRENHSLSACSS